MAAAEEKRVVAGRTRRSSCRVQSTVTVCTVFRSGQVCSTSRGKRCVSLRRLARDRSLRRASARATRSPVLAHRQRGERRGGGAELDANGQCRLQI